MKKMMMMAAMLALSLVMQAQTRFHDVEANEAKGAVKTMTITMMGNARTIEFTADGKMNSKEISDAKYDADGYLQSNRVQMMGQKVSVKYSWENGRLKGQVVNVMGQDITTTNNYDENGSVTSATINMGGQVTEVPYSDYKYDEHGNWISRKSSMMGQEQVITRAFTYYE